MDHYSGAKLLHCNYRPNYNTDTYFDSKARKYFDSKNEELFLA